MNRPPGTPHTPQQEGYVSRHTQVLLDGIPVDQGMVDDITLLWSHQIATFQCCEGDDGRHRYVTVPCAEEARVRAMLPWVASSMDLTVDRGWVLLSSEATLPSVERADDSGDHARRRSGAVRDVLFADPSYPAVGEVPISVAGALYVDGVRSSWWGSAVGPECRGEAAYPGPYPQVEDRDDYHRWSVTGGKGHETRLTLHVFALDVQITDGVHVWGREVFVPPVDEYDLPAALAAADGNPFAPVKVILQVASVTQGPVPR